MQGKDPGYAWAVTVIMFYLKALGGLIGTVLSICWMVQVVLYMFAYPPISPFLNSLFMTLDGIFPLFGTAAFALFCFYLIGEHFHQLILRSLSHAWPCQSTFAQPMRGGLG